jgi:hypothetical protein
MPLATRINSTNASVMTIGTYDVLADAQSCTVTINNKTEDAKGGIDRWGYMTAVGSDWEFSGQFFADSAAGTTLAQLGTANPPRGAFAFTDGADAYAGTVTLTSVVKQWERDTLTKFQVSGQGYGALQVT